MVISPISAAIGMAFQRRERALVALASFRSFSYQLYLAHSMWDWNEAGGRDAVAEGVDWLHHSDAVLAQLVGIGDELSRFLTLPTTSRSRHRMTRQGRREASKTMEVSYLLVDSMCTHRMTRLAIYAERLKKIGLPSGEASRVRQYERFISDTLEQLRMVKMYRTPQALRSLARTFTLLLPPFYAPSFAKVAHDTNSLGVGIANGVIVALALTGLFLSLEVLEDPFTAFLALDGIDCREELEVLHYAHLVQTRKLVFPDAPHFPSLRRAALRDTAELSTFPSRSPHPDSSHGINQEPGVPAVVDLAVTDTVSNQDDQKVDATPSYRGKLKADILPTNGETTGSRGQCAPLDGDDDLDVELGVPIADSNDRDSSFHAPPGHDWSRPRLRTATSQGSVFSRIASAGNVTSDPSKTRHRRGASHC